MPTLNWIGKEKIVNHHQDVPFRVLEHVYGFTAKGEQKEPTNTGNLLIHGDNLEALKALIPEYEGRVDVVYIDPPYNTGNENWIYNDNVNDPKILKWLGEIVGGESDDFCRHDKWLCMMYPRIKLLHKLLSERGVIFVSINFIHEHPYLRCLLDDIFGKNNYVGELTWESTTQPINSGSARFGLQQKVEPIMFYAKNKKLQKGYKLKEIENGLNYPHTGKFGPCRFAIIEKSDAGSYARDTMKFPILGQTPREGKRWQIGKDTADELVKQGKIEIIDGVVKRAVYPEDELDKVKYIPFWSHLNASEFGTAQSGKDLLNEILGRPVGFDTVKPPELIQELISHFPSDSIILDSFAGSGTTAHAVLKQNKIDGGTRKFICIEMEDYAETITSERLKNVIKGYKFNGTKKIELSSYSLNLSLLNNTEKIISQYNEFKEDSNYKEVKLESNNGVISITAKENISDEVSGLGGSFDFRVIGEPLFLNSFYLNEKVGEDKIREYIYYTETKQPLKRKRAKDNWYILENFNQTGIYFYYEPEKVTTLDLDSLSIVKEKQEQYIIYADHCLLDPDYMFQNNIIFKKIPRDIKRF